MAYHGSGLPDALKLASKREIRFYIRYIESKGIKIHQRRDGVMAHDLYNAITSDCSKNTQPFIEEMVAESQKRLVAEESLNWLEKSERACYWAWLMVQQERMPTAAYRDNMTIYGSLKLSTTASSSKERFSHILDFLDFWKDGMNRKKKLIEDLQSEWAKIYALPAPFSWLSKKDKAQCEWVWNYMKDSVRVDPHNITPLDDEEKYHAIYAVFDAFIEGGDNKKLFLIELGRAKNQKKYRSNQSEKKLLNTYIHNDAKSKLSQLAKKRNKKMSEILEDLILQEYLRAAK